MEVDLCLCLCVSFSEATQSNEWKGYRANLREILDAYKVQLVVCGDVGVCGVAHSTSLHKSRNI